MLCAWPSSSAEVEVPAAVGYQRTAWAVLYQYTQWFTKRICQNSLKLAYIVRVSLLFWISIGICQVDYSESKTIGIYYLLYLRRSIIQELCMERENGYAEINDRVIDSEQMLVIRVKVDSTSIKSWWSTSRFIERVVGKEKIPSSFKWYSRPHSMTIRCTVVSLGG